jgi:hypothetical protein
MWSIYTIRRQIFEKKRHDCLPYISGTFLCAMDDLIKMETYYFSPSLVPAASRINYTRWGAFVWRIFVPKIRNKTYSVYYMHVSIMMVHANLLWPMHDSVTCGPMMIFTKELTLANPWLFLHVGDEHQGDQISIVFKCCCFAAEQDHCQYDDPMENLVYTKYFYVHKAHLALGDTQRLVN